MPTYPNNIPYLSFFLSRSTGTGTATGTTTNTSGTSQGTSSSSSINIEAIYNAVSFTGGRGSSSGRSSRSTS